MKICPRCGRENLDDARFCSGCATPLGDGESAREERKVVTVLFCDLVGSTAQAERMDPEDVRALLSHYHERVRTELERFGGTVEKFIGDAVMALFGAPAAHEDDPERAVRAALAIREWAQEGELQIRIGITTGEAFVALGARPEAGEGMASGDVVNTAARLQSAAPENGIVVDETTYRATSHVIDFGEGEPVAAKGKSAPVPAWRVLAARSRLGVDVRQHGAARLVGRERELELLTGTLARVRAERSPQLLTLVGAPGIGKSRLVFELMQRLELDPELVTWRQGRSLPYGEGASFWALGEMVKAQASILESDAAAKVEAKLRRAVEDVVAEAKEAAWVTRHLRPLVGLATDEDLSLDRQDEAFAAWRSFLEALAERRPLVLVFEDLHFADEGLLDFVDHLVEWATGVPILVVCTARPELLDHRAGWGGGKLNAATLALSPLNEQETARLLSEVLARSVLVAETQSILLERAGGNPLYAEQFARLYVERGSAEDLPVPETVQGIVGARLDTVPPEEKELLQDASVIGKVFWTGALRREPDSLRRLLHSLERKGFVRRERRTSVAGEEEYAFSHLLVRDVAYGQIPRAARVGKHRLAAEWIESLGRPEDHAELLAHHYDSALTLARAAGRVTSELAERARRALRRAGDRASSLNAYASAVRHYAGALELWPEEDVERARVLLAYGTALYHGEARGEEQLVTARDELLSQGDVEGAATAEARAGELTWEREQSEVAFPYLEHAVELLRNQPGSRAKTYALTSLARPMTFTGRHAEAIPLAVEALSIAEDLGLDEFRARALNYAGTARLFAGELRGVADLEQSLEVALACNAPIEALRAYNNFLGMVGDVGEVARAVDLGRDALALAERLGHRHWIGWHRRGLAQLLYATGRWDEALGLGEDEVVRGLIEIAHGEATEDLVERARAYAQDRAARRADFAAEGLTFLARVLLALRPREEADQVGDHLLSVLLRTTHLRLAWWHEVVVVFLSLGRSGDLLRVLEQQRATPWIEAATMCARGEFALAADRYAELGHAYAEADCRLRAAHDSIEAGRRREGEAQLRRALALYRSVGATRYVGEAESLFAPSA